ncbi:MAG TPA: hypothetical protein PLD22_02270 [Bacillota bacterium]|jgi:hypothetical protein|nr:hypothetical protein [Bacillota bacterium]HQC82134.1 hypothetical protein [Bacillota bacterium]
MEKFLFSLGIIVGKRKRIIAASTSRINSENRLTIPDFLRKNSITVENTMKTARELIKR